MSSPVDIKPVFESIRIKKEPVEYDNEPKIKKPTIKDMVRRRRTVLRKRGKRKRRKRRRKKRNKTVTKIVRAISGARKALVHNLGFDPQKEKPCDFSPVIPDDPSLPDSEEKDLEQEKEKSTTPSAPPEDLLDIILGKQEKLFADKPKKKVLTIKEIEEKEERRRKKQEKLEKLKEGKLKEKKMREEEKKKDEIKQVQTKSPVKRKSRFSDAVVTDIDKQIQLNFNVPQVPVLNKPPTPPRTQIPLPNPSLVVDPNLLTIIQNNVINQNIQQALRQQQINNELLQLQAAQNLYAQIVQNPFLPPQPQVTSVAPVIQPPVSYGLTLPPPPPADPNVYNFDNNSGINYNYMVPPPPPSSDMPSTSDENKKSESTRKRKDEHVEKVASVVKPFADKYGKQYRLSSSDYKKMCKKIVKKIAKYNSPPRPERVEHLVKEYAQYLRNKADKHKYS